MGDDDKQITEVSTDTDDESIEDLEQQAIDEEKAELDALEDESDTPATVIKTAEAKVDADDDAKTEPVTIETLTKQIEDLTKSQKGTYEGLKAEKIKRQAAEDRNNRVEDALLEIQAERTEKLEAKKLDETTKIPPKRIAAQVDQETGEVYFLEDQLKKAAGDPTETVTQTVDDFKAQYEYDQAVRESNRLFDEFVYDGVSSDESFIPALPKLDNALDFLKVELQGLTDKVVRSGQALDLLHDNESVLAEFETKFPGMDHTLVIRAYDSTLDFKKALKSIAGEKEVTPVIPVVEPKTLSAADNLKKIAGLTKGIVTQKNQKVDTGEVDLTDYSELSQDDIDKLSDAEIEKLDRALAIAQDGPQ